MPIILTTPFVAPPGWSLFYDGSNNGSVQNLTSFLRVDDFYLERMDSNSMVLLNTAAGNANSEVRQINVSGTSISVGNAVTTGSRGGNTGNRNRAVNLSDGFVAVNMSSSGVNHANGIYYWNRQFWNNFKTLRRI